MARQLLSRVFLVLSTTSLVLLPGSFSWAVDINGVQMYAMSQPQIYAMLQRTSNGTPLQSGGEFGFRAYYDTGASGVLLSKEIVDALGVSRATSNGALVTFEDVGVGGSETFNVSEPLYVSLAPYQPNVNTEIAASYNQTFGALRTQIGLTEGILEPLNVIGMPAMHGKVIVMDPKPVEDASSMEDMRTYVYNPGTPYSSTNQTNPGIPTTNHHVSLSYAAFDRFTAVSPNGATGPTLHENPFIGSNPVAALEGNSTTDSTPGITVTLGNHTTTGSFLLDTGAGTSMISKNIASKLHIRYVDGSEAAGDPQLETYDPKHPELAGAALPASSQFQLTIGGIGDSKTVAGFYLDSLIVPTQEASSLDSNDSNNLRFLKAPILVSDISVQDPITNDALTLDGVFGMNFLVASACISGGLPTDIRGGAFNWAVFDEPNGVLGLDLKTVPEPATYILLAAGAMMCCLWRRFPFALLLRLDPIKLVLQLCLCDKAAMAQPAEMMLGRPNVNNRQEPNPAGKGHHPAPINRGEQT